MCGYISQNIGYVLKRGRIGSLVASFLPMPIAGPPALAGQMTRYSLPTKSLRFTNFHISRWTPFNNNSASGCRSFASRPLATRSPISLHLPYTNRQMPYTSLNASIHEHSNVIKLLSTSPRRHSSKPSKSIPHPTAESVPQKPYRAKRVWPPDMSKLSPKQQFKLERKYRRRSRLKYARPVWTKWTKLVQWWAIGFVFIYCVFFLDLDRGPNPFEPIRESARGIFKDVFSTQPRDAAQSDSSKADRTNEQRRS